MRARVMYECFVGIKTEIENKQIKIKK